MNPIGQCVDQFIKQVHNFRSALLQALDNFHAGEQTLFLSFQTLDLFDLLVEQGDFLGQDIVSLILVADKTIEGPADQHN